MQIKTKLIISFLAVALIGGLIGFIGFIGVNDVFIIFDEIADDTAPELLLLGKIDSLSHELQLEAISYVFLIQTSATDEDLHEEHDEFEKTNKELDEIITNLIKREEAEVDDELEEKEFLGHIVVIKKRLYDASLSFIEESEKDNNPQILVAMKNDLEQIEEDLHSIITHRLDLEKNELEKQDTIADELAVTTSNVIIITSIGGFVLALSLGIIMSDKISTPIKKLRDVAKIIDSGYLEINVNPQGDDEIKNLGESFNSMIIGLKKIKKLEEEKIKNEKINTLGNITSSLAHNLKNLNCYLPISLN